MAPTNSTELSKLISDLKANVISDINVATLKTAEKSNSKLSETIANIINLSLTDIIKKYQNVKQYNKRRIFAISPIVEKRLKTLKFLYYFTCATNYSTTMFSQYLCAFVTIFLNIWCQIIILDW